MEQLLVHCAIAIESNNATLAQQILWVLNNTTPQDGDSNQRLAGSFIRALINGASKTGSCKMLEAVTETASSYNRCNNLAMQIHKFSAIELANFIDLTPWHRFGFTAANSTILEATKGFSVIHIVDLSLTHCMQIPTLIDAIANRDEVPPLIKLTVADSRNMNIMPIPPCWG
ncbi:protein SHORT-ROOT [Trifolium repens]|nr:protein SHORT-ROOT [Trifolium repens]